jgi:hypothetical protein
MFLVVKLPSNIITDAGPFLTALVNSYSTTVDAAKSKLIADLDKVVKNTKVGYSSVIPSMVTFIAENPLKLYIDGDSFRASASALNDAVNLESQNIISAASASYQIQKNNIKIDFNQVMSDAYESFNNSLYSATITDVDYDTKYDTAQLDMTAVSDNFVQVVSDAFTAADETVQALQLEMMNQISSLVKSHIYNRPLLRLTGPLFYPTRLVFNKAQDFGLEIQNIGKKDWTGSFDLQVTDEYYKKFIAADSSNFLISIAPGETKKIMRSITIPKSIAVQQDDGSMATRSFGKKLKYRFILNTKKTGD